MSRHSGLLALLVRAGRDFGDYLPGPDKGRTLGLGGGTSYQLIQLGSGMEEWRQLILSN